MDESGPPESGMGEGREAPPSQPSIGLLTDSQSFPPRPCSPAPATDCLCSNPLPAARGERMPNVPPLILSVPLLLPRVEGGVGMSGGGGKATGGGLF